MLNNERLEQKASKHFGHFSDWFVFRTRVIEMFWNHLFWKMIILFSMSKSAGFSNLMELNNNIFFTSIDRLVSRFIEKFRTSTETTTCLQFFSRKSYQS